VNEQHVHAEPHAGTGRAPVPDRVGLIAARSKAEAQELAPEVARAMAGRGVDVVPEEDLAFGDSARHQVDAIVVLGGDGLMMRAANAYPDVPLLGINFGNVGFLALVERRDWQPAVAALLAGEYFLQEGPTLQANRVRGAEAANQGWAINDVVLRAGLRMVDVEIYIDGHYVNTYPGDGMIVATPHGSTAYGMAAGGPILTAGVHGFAIVPINCHSPIRTPFVVPEEATIELVLANERDCALILDGREHDNVQQWDIVRVVRGEHVFRLVTLRSTNFYEAFRTKFNFRIRPDAIPSRANHEHHDPPAEMAAVQIAQSTRERSAATSRPRDA
jgi:NAD+ kinase